MAHSSVQESDLLLPILNEEDLFEFEPPDFPEDIFPEGELGSELDLDELVSAFVESPDVPSGSERDVGMGATQVSPSTSESGVRNSSPERKTLGSNSGSEAQGKNTKNSVEEEKRLERMRRNRENAQLSRMRKKQQFAQLQQTCASLQSQNAQLNCFIQRLVAENCLLRRHLTTVCEKARIEVPNIPSALNTPAVSQGPPAVKTINQTTSTPSNKEVHSTRTSMPDHSEQQNSENVVNSVQKEARAAAGAQVRESSHRPSKRAKIRGAGAALITLFSLFMFISPISFQQVEKAQTLAGYLPGGTNTGQAIVPTAQKGHGRALLMSQDDAESNHGGLHTYLKSTIDSILEEKSVQQLPGTALKKLEDIAAAAVVLDKDLPGSQNRFAASTVFPILAEKFFESSGMDAPQMCQKVFEFSASAVPHPIKNRKSVEKYIMSTYGFKGRSAGLEKTIPDNAKNILPSGTSLRIADDQEKASEGYAEDDSHSLLPTNLNEPVLVSLLLPANSSRDSQAGISAVDQVFIVLLDPQNKFATYSCGLPRSLVI